MIERSHTANPRSNLLSNNIMTAHKKRVRFSETSQLVILPNLEHEFAGPMWYCEDEMDSFKQSVRQSVAKIRTAFSRGDPNDIRTCEILGLEKHLTLEVSYHGRTYHYH